MQGLHSIEIKKVLEQHTMKRSRCDPDSATNLTTYSNNSIHSIKHSSSSSTLYSTPSDISLIQQRYRTLQLEYRHLLEQTKKKGELFRKQRQQLQKYKITHEKDRKEIDRLKSLIGFVNKTQIPTQNHTTQPLSSSLITRQQKHTSSLPKQHRLSKPPSPIRQNPTHIRQVHIPKSTGTLRKMGTRKFQNQNQYSRLKFTPSVCLQ